MVAVHDGTRRRCRKRGKWVNWLYGVALLPILIGPAVADDADQAALGGTIKLGRVSNNSEKHYAALDALGRYLVEKSDSFERHQTLLARNNEEMIEFLRQGKVDLVSESAFSAVLYERAVDANILLRQWKGGRASYQTLFFARKHSGIHRIDDLAGKLIAFEDEGSTSGYFVPKATIVDHDIVLKPVDQPRRVNDVGYIFAESEVNVVAWVARGKVDAGVLSDVHWVNESRAPLALKKQLHVFHTTPEIVRSVLIAGPELSGERLDGVVDILLDMSENDDGRAVLKAFYKTDRFDRLVGEAKASLDHIRRLFDRLEAPPS